MQFTIRRAKKSDIPAIAELFRGAFESPPYNEKWGKKGALKRIRMHLRKYDALTARSGRGAAGELLGFIIFYADFWFGKNIVFINDLVVARKHRKSGIGKALLGKAESRHRKNGARESYLLAMRGSDAFRFYRHRKYLPTNWVLMRRGV